MGDPREIIKKFTHAGGHSQQSTNDKPVDEQVLAPAAKKVCVMVAASAIIAAADKQLKTANSESSDVVNAA